MKYQINSDKSFTRDTKTHAILKTHDDTIDNYNKRKSETKKLKEEINKLKNDITDIRSILDNLQNRNNQCH